jgi:Cu(I)/Ag(I) efflux system protein CusF
MNPQRLFIRNAGPFFVLFAAIASPAWAASDKVTNGANSTLMAQATTADMTDGEVRKVDKEAGKLTLRHGEIKNLDMPPMTMVFIVKDKAMLDTLKAGDKIRFKAINDAGKFTVTEMQMAQ